MVYFYIILLEKIGFDYLVIKSTCAGLLAWSATELLFTGLIEGKDIPLRPIADYYAHMLGALAFGVTMGLLFKKYLFNRAKV